MDEVETKTPEEEAPAEAEGAPKEAPAGEAPARPAKRPWWEYRIAEETAKRHEERAQREALERKLQVAEEALRAAAKGEGGSPSPEGARVDVEAIRKEIRAEESMRAANALAEAQFTETCNRIAIAGKKEFKDFDARVQALQTAQALTPEMVLMAAEMDNPAAIIHALGDDIDEAMRIKALAPAKQAGAMAKLALALEGGGKAPAKRASSAPEPITPIRGSPKGEVDLFDDKTDIADWIAVREREMAERRKAGR